MKNDIKFIKQELLRQYKPKFILFTFLIILLLLSPLLFVYNDVIFDAKEFSNIYLSTIFGSILLALILQIIEIYKTGLNMYSKAYGIVLSLEKLIMVLKIKLANNDVAIEFYGDLLFHYKESLLQSFTSDNDVNEILLELCNQSEIIYISQSLKNSGSINEAKKKEILLQLEELHKKVINTKNRL